MNSKRERVEDERDDMDIDDPSMENLLEGLAHLGISKDTPKAELTRLVNSDQLSERDKKALRSLMSFLQKKAVCEMINGRKDYTMTLNTWQKPNKQYKADRDQADIDTLASKINKM